MYDPTDIVPILLTLDPPYNTMEPPKFFAVANYRNPLGSYDSGVMILKYNVSTDNFTVHQFLNEYAPFELESFTGKINPVAHKNFLSVSGKLFIYKMALNPKNTIFEEHFYIRHEPAFKVNEQLCGWLPDFHSVRFDLFVYPAFWLP